MKTIAENRSAEPTDQPEADVPDNMMNTQQLVPFDTNMCIETTSSSQDDMICAHFGLPRLGEAHQMASFSSDPSVGSYIIGCTAFSSDATNSSIFQRQKLQGLIVTSALLKDWEALKAVQYQDAFVAMTALWLVRQISGQCL